MSHNDSSSRNHILPWLLMLGMLVLVSACGGGGSSGKDDSEKTATSEWDTMKWNEGEWQ